MTDDLKEDSLSSQLKKSACNDELSEEDATELIAKNLREENKELILKIVKIIGVKQAMVIYNETLKIEEAGGLKREDRKGKKTPGGVFFYLLHHNQDMFDENLKKVFTEEAHKKEKERRQQIKEERRRKAELLKARFIEEGLLTIKNQSMSDKPT